MLINPTEEVRKEENRLYKEFTKIDPFTGWFYKPHTISILLITVMILVYLAFTQHSTNSGFEINTKYGLFTSCLIFLLFSSVEMRDGLFVRPHPVIWRVIKGIAVIYLLVIVFLLFQTVDDARLLLKKIDPTLGVPLPERSYAENCTIYTPNDYHPFRYVYEALHDEFVFAHLFGWFGKAILLRDFYISWFLSISFELLEMSFEHMLPNFAECWWDHIILDILVCNGIGIYLGLKVSHLFSFRPYHWIYSKIRPEVEEYHWEVLKSFKRLCSVLLLIIFISIIELNTFFLKFTLWIPPRNFLNVIRLFIWWSIGLPGVREYYQFVTDKNCNTFGTMAWLCVIISGVELLVCIKFGRGMFPKKHPKIVIIAWICFITLFLIWMLYHYKLKHIWKEKFLSTKRNNNKHKLN